MKKIALAICPPFWVKTPPFGLEHLKNAIKDYVHTDIYDLNIYFFRLLRKYPSEWLRLNSDLENNLFDSVNKGYLTELNSITARLSNYDYVGLSLYRRNLNFSIELAKKINDFSASTKIIFGGPQTREIDTPPVQASILIKGQGQIPLQKIIRGQEEKILPYEEIDDLDSLPFLTFGDFNLSLYKPILPLLTSRGCIKRCSFCSEWGLYKKFRLHSPSYVINQIKYLVNRYNIKTFSFQDSLINADLGWLTEFCSGLIRENLKVQWEAQIIIRNDLDTGIMKLMKSSGCINLFVGLESASNQVLNHMNKGFTIEEAKMFLKKLRGTGLSYGISLIVGYPAETEEDFKKTAAFLKDNKAIIQRIAQVSTFTLYKNSLLYKTNPKLLPQEQINTRFKRIADIIKKEKIPHKKAFLDNLRYKDGD